MEDTKSSGTLFEDTKAGRAEPVFSSMLLTEKDFRLKTAYSKLGVVLEEIDWFIAK